VDGRPPRGLDELRDYYLERVASSTSSSRGRLVHRQDAASRDPLGLIALMFPRSPIIHVLRHPLDVVLSTFSTT